MINKFNEVNDSLIKNWFYKLRNKDINDSILIIVYSGKLEDLVKFDLVIKMNLDVYYLVPYINYSKIEGSKKNKIIVLDPTLLKTITLELIKEKMLIVESNHDFFNNIEEFTNPEIYNEININEKELSLFYLKKEDISALLKNLQSENLSNLIVAKLNLLKKINFNIEFILTQNLNLFNISSNENFNTDIEMLYKHNVLTSRLAVIIYRLFSLKIYANVTEIGRSIYKITESKSKPFTKKMISNLSTHKEITISHDLSNKVFKAYDLNVNDNELRIRIEIAMELLSFKIKELTIDVISKSTKLPIETIKKLNSKFNY